MSTKKYFGTDGVRGEVGGPIINPETLTTLACAVASLIRDNSPQNPLAIIGCDTRESCEMAETAIKNGFIASGVDVILLKVVPTPAVAFFTKKLQATVGVMISASHNLYHDNGVKFMGENGSKFSDAWEIKIEALMASDKKTPPLSSGKISVYDNAVPDYQAHCLSYFKNLSLKNYKIVMDCANGATYQLAPAIFKALHANLVLIHAEPNGRNINAQCGATDVGDLQERVLSEKADVGLAFDGDGDRLMMVDSTGEKVDGDEILCILATASSHYPAVVGTLMSNLGLEKALTSNGIQFERVCVGDRYVLEKLTEKGWRLGGEASGHIINLDFASTGDGILSALQVLQTMFHTQKSLHDLKKIMKKRPHILINVPVQNPSKFSSMSRITNAVLEAEEKLKGEGRVLLRASGTESCVRVMVECDEESQAKNMALVLAAIVNECFSEKIS